MRPVALFVARLRLLPHPVDPGPYGMPTDFERRIPRDDLDALVEFLAEGTR